MDRYRWNDAWPLDRGGGLDDGQENQEEETLAPVTKAPEVNKQEQDTDASAFAPAATPQEEKRRNNEKEPEYVKEIEAEVDMNVFAMWINNGIGLIALSMSAFLIYPVPDHSRQLPIAYGFSVIAIIIFIWATVVYFARGAKRHYSIWLLIPIVFLIVLGAIGLLVIL